MPSALVHIRNKNSTVDGVSPVCTFSENRGEPETATYVSLQLATGETMTYRYLPILHSERPKLYEVLAVLSAIGLITMSYEFKSW